MAIKEARVRSGGAEPRGMGKKLYSFLTASQRLLGPNEHFTATSNSFFTASERLLERLLERLVRPTVRGTPPVGPHQS